MNYQRVYLEDDTGKISLDVRTRTGSSSGPEKVIIMLHGVTGTAYDPYLQDLAGVCAEEGISAVCMNHFAPPGERNVRLMDMS